MTLKLFNTLTGQEEEFMPIHSPHVGMYVCGITAYDACHLGHARGAVVFDMVFRYLKYLKFDVTYVKNFTDIDDKIIQRAMNENRNWKDIAEQYINEYNDDMGQLNVLSPTHTPKATDNIDAMIQMIDILISTGKAYEADGNVFYAVREFSGYGKLSGKNIEDLESGVRINVDKNKKDPLDFALWKKAKEDEPFWPSPWGNGRPGWHIECSAMSTQILGQPFDIHGGGRDLIFPHHENEIAQAEGACPHDFVHYWMHNGFVNINAEKMSKSLGNFTTIRDLLSAYDAEAIRLFLLSNHYRSPIDYTNDTMQRAAVSLDRYYDTLSRLYQFHPGKAASDIADDSDSARELKLLIDKFDDEFTCAMNSDFNSAQAIGYVFELIRALNRYLDDIGINASNFTGWVVLRITAIQQMVSDVLGLFGLKPMEYKQRLQVRAQVSAKITEDDIERYIHQRKQARVNHDFATADQIRDELLNKGVEIKDLPGGETKWQYKT